MNYYIDLINASMEYLENNIMKNISLETIAKEVSLSQYHFERLFNIIVGKSFKKYLMGRKLTLAAERIINSRVSIIDIALDFGFEYPEVFSRAFKKQFGIPPKLYRGGGYEIEKVKRPEIVTRSFISYNGGITLQADYVMLGEIELCGINIVVNVKDKLFNQKLTKCSTEFTRNTSQCMGMKQDRIFSIVNCTGDEDGTYTIFFGKEATEKIVEDSLINRDIPQGYYACLSYEGDLSEIRETLEEDILRWIVAREIKLRNVGIGMFTIFDNEYFHSNKLKIYIPILEPLK